MAGVGGPQGNQYGVALKDPIIRQKAYQSFCDHLALGKSVKSWFYEDDDNLCCWETMLSYIQKFPMEFQPIKKKISEIKGFHRWESVVEASAEGKNKDASTASLQMLMRNKYGWDKEQQESAPPKESEFTAGHEAMKASHEKDKLIEELQAKLDAIQQKTS